MDGVPRLNAETRSHLQQAAADGDLKEIFWLAEMIDHDLALFSDWEVVTEDGRHIPLPERPATVKRWNDAYWQEG